MNPAAHRKIASISLFCFLLLSSAQTARGQSSSWWTVYGPKRLDTPVEQTDTFAAIPEHRHTLRVTREDSGNETVPVGFVAIHGVEVVGKPDLRTIQHGGTLQRQVRLERTNTISVLIRVNAVGAITVEVVDEDLKPAVLMSAMVTPAGGTFTLSNPSSRFHGMSLSVPAGALSQDTVISILAPPGMDVPGKFKPWPYLKIRLAEGRFWKTVIQPPRRSALDAEFAQRSIGLLARWKDLHFLELVVARDLH